MDKVQRTETSSVSHISSYEPYKVQKFWLFILKKAICLEGNKDLDIYE
jgi:hypothetical protein